MSRVRPRRSICAPHGNSLVNLRRISWVTGLLVVGLALVAADAYKSGPSHFVSQAELPLLVEIPHREFSPDEYRAIQETFWTKIQGKDRHCAESFVFAYMDTLRTRCEIKGEAKDIGGGCAHMTNAMNSPENGRAASRERVGQ